MNKLNFKKKIVIGTANFTQRYGADLTRVKREEIKNIFNLAKKNKIYEIDTAESYLKNKNIFKYIDKKFQFHTKIVFDHKWTSLKYCLIHLDQHIKKLNTNNISTIYFHDKKVLLTKDGEKIFKNLELLKKKNFFKKIGLSIYDTNHLSLILKKYNIDIIQCPFNILDRRIITTGWFNRLKKRGIEVHVRSIFLQGLLVNKLVYEKKFFKKWKKNFYDWFQVLKNENISPIDHCLSDLLQYNFDKIIIGINNSDNLKKILNFKIINKSKMFNLRIADKKLIDPRNWK